MGMKKRRIKRMKKEYVKLCRKIKLMDAALCRVTYAKQRGHRPLIEGDQAKRLLRQRYYMNGYRSVLGARIDADGGERWVGSSDVNIPRDDY